MLHKRGNVWFVKFMLNGKLIRRSTGSTNKKEAEKREREIRAEAASKLKRKAVKHLSGITYSEAIIKWKNTSMPKSMESHARNTRPYLDHVRLENVPSATYDMIADMQQRGLDNQTINRRLSVVIRILNLAYKKWDWLDKELASKIEKLPEKGLAREIYLSRDEFVELIDAVDKQEARDVLCLAVNTGMRMGEIYALEPGNWKKPYLVLHAGMTKSGKARSVPLVEELHHLMDNLPIKIHRESVRWYFEKARKKIGREEIRMHDLRHTFASWIASDPNIASGTLRDLLGHSSLLVTDKYTHLQGNTFEAVSRTLTGHNTGHTTSTAH